MQLVILSGPPGAGKSAVATALCERYDRMLHVEMEQLRVMLRMGLLRPWDGSPEGRSQRQLFVAAACDLSVTFLEAGYGVVIDDVVTPDELSLYIDGLRGIEPAHFVVLLPSEAAMAEQAGAVRNASRMQALRDRFADWAGVAVVEPDGLAPRLVADAVMALAGEGRALLRDVPSLETSSGA